MKIQTQEGNEHEISHEIACKSLIIKNMLEGIHHLSQHPILLIIDIGDNGDTPIPLSNVSAEIFVKVFHIHSFLNMLGR